MIKSKVLVILMVIMMISVSTGISAQEDIRTVNIDIVSPEGIKDYPGIEDTIVAQITNNTGADLNQVLAYITMADLKKNMTVNLEDYGADKPVYIEAIKAGESVSVELPIRFVYTSEYHLYVSVVSKDNNIINSSDAIPIKILGNTQINKTLATSVAIGMPIILLVLVIIVYGIRKKKYNV